jgi:alginate O-acetyltransferase complex protein AlgI
MLFNSYIYLLVFLPATLVVYHSLRHAGRRDAAMISLAIASLVFYGWWNPRYVVLLLGLMAFNYVAVRWLVRNGITGTPRSKLALSLAIAGNLAALGWFKYANFFVVNVDHVFGTDYVLRQIILPLGISFFTFQKIALLVDAYRGKVKSLDLLDYSLFVVFFPQLIAGPIVHYSETMPQFHARPKVTASLFALGSAMLTIGLAKKVLLADNLAHFATPVFSAAASGTHLSFALAWSGALAYALQLYYDFSGYTDMAIGAALMFGIRLPVNFNSPYKATSVIEFWHRWHMTLARFLRDYLYIPLGGNRKGPVRRYLNLFITMVLGGLWHGAAWTFVFWGALHGAYLIVNHAWRGVAKLIGADALGSPIVRTAGWALTFFAVVAAWVLFRAASVRSALAMLAAMAGLNGSIHSLEAAEATQVGTAMVLILPLLALAWFAPNSQELTGYAPPGTSPNDVTVSQLRWRPSVRWAFAFGCIFALAFLSLSKVSEFIYFQF